MEYIIQVLILFITLNTLLKISFWRWWQAMLFAAIAGIFVLTLAPAAASQSKTQLETWMQTPVIMQNVAVLITLETLIILAFTFMRLRKTLGTNVKTDVMTPLNSYPGLLLFPVLFYTLTQLFFSLPGVAFETVARSMAAGVFLLIPLFSWGLSRLIPEEELRLEIQFIVSLFVCFIGLISTVNGETTYSPVNQTLDTHSLLLALSIFVVLLAWGFIRQKYRKRKIE